MISCPTASFGSFNRYKIKIMKKLFFIALALAALVEVNAQEKLVADTIWVNGICDMCEERIENAAYIKGVKKADWTRETHQLVLLYRSDKTDLMTIKRSIAAAGHDTRDIKATDKQYQQVHHCCRYRELLPH